MIEKSPRSVAKFETIYIICLVLCCRMFIWEHSTRSKACTLPSQGPTPISCETQSLQQMQKEEPMTRQPSQPCHSSAQPSGWYSAELFCFLFGRCLFLTDGGLHNDDKCEWAAVISAHHLCITQYRQSNTPLLKRGGGKCFQTTKIST